MSLGYFYFAPTKVVKRRIIMTANEIRKDLKNIRYYYSRQSVFDKVTDTIG